MTSYNTFTTFLAGLVFSFTCIATLAGESGLHITKQWIREAPPMASMLAGYLQFKNTTDKNLVLAAVSSPDFRKIEVHRTEITEGVTRMVRQNRVVIPANGMLAFEPTGYHLMLMKPVTRLREGDIVHLSMELEGGRSVSVTVPVKKGGSDALNRLK